MSSEYVQQPPTLKRRIIQSGVWVFGGHIGSQGLRLVSNLIMTRLLVPEMFGIVALASTVIVGLSLFSDVGLKQNIIQHSRGSDPDFLNTAWVIQILRGALIWLMALLGAAVLYWVNLGENEISESVYAEPVLPFVLAALSFQALISGFNSTKLETANRDLTMGRITLIELVSQITTIVVMILWAMIDRSIWALVAGSIVGTVLKVVLSHVALPGENNRFHWERDAFMDIFHFGKWIFLSSILGFVTMNGDKLLLGGLVNTATLGFYTIAFFMASSVQQIVLKIAQTIVFPALSEINRTRPQELASVYYRIRKPIDILSLFLAGVLIVSGQTIIDVLYDSRYAQAGWMLQILSVSLIFGRYAVFMQLLLTLGKSNLFTLVVAIQAVGILLGLPVFHSLFGLEAAIYVVAGNFILVLPVIFYYQGKYGFLSLYEEVRHLYWLVLGLVAGLAANWILSTLAEILL